MSSEKSSYKKYQYVELGWNLEDNELINQWYVDGGAKVNKRFRMYRKELKPINNDTAERTA